MSDTAEGLRKKTVLVLGEAEAAIIFRADGIQPVLQEGEKEPNENFAMALAVLLTDHKFTDTICDWVKAARPLAIEEAFAMAFRHPGKPESELNRGKALP